MEGIEDQDQCAEVMEPEFLSLLLVTPLALTLAPL